MELTRWSGATTWIVLTSRPRRGCRWARHLGRDAPKPATRAPARRRLPGSTSSNRQRQSSTNGFRNSRPCVLGPRGAARGGEGGGGRRLRGSPETSWRQCARKSRLPRTSSAPKARSSPASRPSWSGSLTKLTPSSQKQGVELQLREIAPTPKARERIWRRRAWARWRQSFQDLYASDNLKDQLDEAAQELEAIAAECA